MSEESNTSTFKLKDGISIIKDVGPWVYAGALAVLYGVGFISLNAYLVRFGVFDFEFVNTRYFLVAANFVLFVGVFYMFAGREVHRGKDWLRSELAWINRNGEDKIATNIAFAHSILSVFFACCLSAAAYTSIAIDRSESAIFYFALAGAFCVKKILEVRNLNSRYPQATRLLIMVTETAAMGVFFAVGGFSMMTVVFFHYFGLIFVVNLVLHRFERLERTTDLLVFTGFFSVEYIIIVAIFFGATIYGNVSPAIGGARAQDVSIALAEDTVKILQPIGWTSKEKTVAGKLVHQTSSYVYISTKEKTLRLRISDVVGMALIPEKEKKDALSAWLESQKKTNTTIPTSKEREVPKAIPSKTAAHHEVFGPQ